MFLSEEYNRKLQNSFQRFVLSCNAYVLKKSIQQLALEEGSIILRSNAVFSEFRFTNVFLTRNKQTMTLQNHLSCPAFFCHLFKSHMKHFDVAVQHSLRQKGNKTWNGSEMASFTPGHFFEMAILYFYLDILG